MKKFLSTICLLAVGLGATAQTKAFDPQNGALLDGKTIVKMNVTGLVTRNFGFYAERILAKPLSFQLGVNVMSTGMLPFASSLASKHPEVADITISSKSITPELRLYLGKGYGSGFYIAPYMRYESHRVAGLNLSPDLSTGAQQDEYTRLAKLRMNGSLSALSGGLLVGAQWKFGAKKNIVLDWSIIGLHAGTAKLTLEGKLPREVADLTEKEVGKLKKDLHDVAKELPELKDKLVDINARGVKVSTDMPFVFFRMALSIGYRF
ncbi:MAG: DUF3575 domain-containing protein [Porphyromonadaceae bacterium]|nr:DUF3575 domain-containing protein [Porphyromonadaceae bacterium]